MTGSVILDLILLLLLVGYAIYGFRAGLVVSLAGIIGIVVGAIAAFFAVPLVASWVSDSVWRVPAVLIAMLALLAGGQILGLAGGRLIRSGVDRTPLKIIDRILGALVDLVVAALLMSAMAFSVSALGVPFLSQSIAGSQVITTVDNITPDPAKAFLAQIRSIAVQDGLPVIVDALSPTVASAAPAGPPDTAALSTAAQSVVKITGNAFQCGQNQSGSGFVVSPGRIVTNAHVVAGVSAPVIDPPSGGAWQGRVVYFDPAADLAVIAVNGLPTKPLALASNLAPGASGVFDGYPLGGPFQSAPAKVQSVPTVEMRDIYGANPTLRQLYYLSAAVQEGNSGGPLLSNSGKVAGVVFAKSTTSSSVGYALTMQELKPVADKASSLSAPVTSGQCIQR
ncbi:MAG: serine protease [Microbacteriaceae bacterium]|nr:serine protease [Microbacteriaceae bacterium]